jgi:hypothetical protein
VVEQELGGLLDLDVAGERGDDGLSMPLARISSTISTILFANTIGGVTIVCQ